MSLEELKEWRYYFSVVPTDADKVVHHIAQQTAVQLQAKGSKRTKMNDFIINYNDDDKKVTPKELKSKLLHQLKRER